MGKQDFTLYSYFGRCGAQLAAAIGLLFASLAFADVPVPMQGKDAHLGVATCAGSNCHGSVKPFKTSPVDQNEYFTWERHDRHARAYETLQSAQSKRIASNLGLRNAAEAEVCLNCHADNVPASKRGARFLMSDGVGCEACHGGSERWLGPHVSGITTHEDNIALGLYPTDEPAARAKLCLGCHQGDAQHPMTHEIMGAGHPPLVFELDTFTSIQPMHFTVDADYKKRKGAPSATTNWAVGQVEAAVAYLSLVENQAGESSGMFPELYPFDCNACHHDMDNLRWSPSVSSKPGQIRLRDAHLRNATDAIAVRDASLAKRWQTALDNLNAASQQGTSQLQASARAFRSNLAKPALDAVAKTWSVTESRQLFARLAGQQAMADGMGYTLAEQGAMALSTLASDSNVGSKDSVATAIETLYGTVDDREQFKPAAYAEAVRGLSAAVQAQ